MPRQELHSDTLPIDQRPPIEDISSYDGDIVLTEKDAIAKDYANELAFMEEPVTIRLEPSSEKNAATRFPVWINGKMAEVFLNGRWVECGYLPTGVMLTVKRKVLEVIIRAKTDIVENKVYDKDSERPPNNVVERYTTPVHNFSIIEDANPRGPAWATEIRRRNL